jgi:hypothetical protein
VRSVSRSWLLIGEPQFFMVVRVFSQPVESLACWVTSIAEWQKRQARSAIALPSPAGNVSGEAARPPAERESPGRLPSAASPSAASARAPAARRLAA